MPPLSARSDAAAGVRERVDAKGGVFRQVAHSSWYRELCPVHRGLIAMSGSSARFQRSYDGTLPCGPKRFQRAEALHFIAFSCFHRLPFLEAPATKETFEFVLEQTRSRHRARVYAYVLMVDGKNTRPTHRDKAAMNGAQTHLFAKLRRVGGSVSGPFAKNSRPTHRDKAAMNGAQTHLFAKLRRAGGSVSGAPAKNSRPTHRDKAAMNGAQTYLFAKLRRAGGSVNGPPAGPLIAIKPR
jgi:hypothetical protein